MSDYSEIKEEDLAPPPPPDHCYNLESGQSQWEQFLEHRRRGTNSKGNDDDVKDEIESDVVTCDKTLKRAFQKWKARATCGNCGKSLSRQKLGVHEMLCYRRDGVPSEKTVDRFGYFKVSKMSHYEYNT